jgi:hypothetical protein
VTERQATALLQRGSTDAPDVFQDEDSGAWIGRVRGRYLTRAEIRIELTHAQDDRVPHLRGALRLIEQAVKANAENMGFGRAGIRTGTDSERRSDADRERRGSLASRRQTSPLFADSRADHDRRDDVDCSVQHDRLGNTGSNSATGSGRRQRKANSLADQSKRAAKTGTPVQRAAKTRVTKTKTKTRSTVAPKRR